jgi:hypothetical protein
MPSWIWIRISDPDPLNRLSPDPETLISVGPFLYGASAYCSLLIGRDLEMIGTGPGFCSVARLLTAHTTFMSRAGEGGDKLEVRELRYPVPHHAPHTQGGALRHLPPVLDTDRTGTVTTTQLVFFCYDLRFRLRHKKDSCQGHFFGFCNRFFCSLPYLQIR